ncbi:MAG: Non-specific serine/threonine protein kinase, partial [Petrotoga mobilis]
MGGKYVFGKSWWGKKWVEALKNIDSDTNRLPRGRSYAKKGAVLEIKIQKNSVISARVQGTRPNPYREKIALPSFTKEEKEKIKKVLNERLDLSAMLIGGNLPEELLDITKNMGIKLFPQSWNEIDAHCSCPDWANPCKHLAAIYYIIADEIDKDPFLIFEMHSMKKKDLIEIAKETEKTSDSIFTDKKEEPIKPMEQPDPSYEKYEIEKVINLLPDEAYFYDGKNFKNLLLRMYNQLSKAINEEDGRVDEEFNPYFKETDIKFIYSPITPNIIFEGEPLEELECKKEKGYYKVHYEDLFDLFGSIPLVGTDEDSEASLFLKRLVSFVYKLIDMKAFIPTPQKINEEDFVIDYSPVYFNDYVRDYVNYLSSIVPGDLVINEKGQYMKKDKIVEYLVSQYIKYLIKKY